MKRFFDFICSLLAIILLSPVLLLLSMVILIDSGRPIVFRQKRVGLNNQLFDIRKFRTMKQGTRNAPTADLKEFDHCVTRCGRFLRKTSLDELPQLFNILIGDMSLVGPRPERPQYVEKFKEEIPRYMIKHQVRPGLTGWAQVNGYRGDTSIRKRIEYDIYYIENWSMSFDFKIMFLTIFRGFINENAY